MDYHTKYIRAFIANEGQGNNHLIERIAYGELEMNTSNISKLQISINIYKELQDLCIVHYLNKALTNKAIVGVNSQCIKHNNNTILTYPKGREIQFESNSWVMYSERSNTLSYLQPLHDKK